MPILSRYLPLVLADDLVKTWSVYCILAQIGSGRLLET